MSGGPIPRQGARPVFLRPIPTRRPLFYVLHDWVVRGLLVAGTLVILGVAFEAGWIVWEYAR